MAITFDESEIGRFANNVEARQTYTIYGATSQGEARDEFRTSVAIPDTVGGFVKSPLEFEVEEIVENIYSGVAIWRSNKKREPGEFSLSFDISGVSTRIMQARQHIGDYAAAGKTPRNFKGAIGVNDGGVEGCDILVPFITHQVTYTFAADDIDDDYIKAMGRIVGTCNNAAWSGYERGEVLCTGISGSKRSDGDWDITFKFAISFNEEDLVIEGAHGNITVPLKRGWEYLWFYFAKGQVTLSSALVTVQRCVSLHLERVYRETNFNTLDIT